MIYILVGKRNFLFNVLMGWICWNLFYGFKINSVYCLFMNYKSLKGNVVIVFYCIDF